MECEDSDVFNKTAKEFTVKDIKNKIEISQNENSDSTKASEIKNVHQVKCKNKNIQSRIQISQDKDNDLTRKSENKNAYKIKYRDKDIEKRKKILQNENSDSTEKSENEDTHKIRYRNKHIRKRIKISQNENSDLVKKLENKDAHQVKRKVKKMQKRIKMSQNDSDSMEESENKDTYKVKDKNKDIRNETSREITSQEENSDSMDVSENENIGKRIKISQYKNDQKSKNIHEAVFRDENVEEKYCVEATHLVHKIKYKNENIHNEKKISQDEDCNSMEVLKNKDIHEVKYKDDNIQNEKKMLQDEDSDSTEKSENENDQVKCKDKDNNSMEEFKNKNAYKVKLKNKDIRNWIKTPQDKDNNLMKKSENINVEKIKCRSENIKNRKKKTQNEDNDLKKELKSEDLSTMDEDIGNRIKILQKKNSDSKKIWDNKYICSMEDSEDEGVKEEYCSEATYLARQMASKERLHQAETIKLYNLHVQLKHTVPPQHEIETRAGSHMPTRKEIEEFKKIIPIKKGSYSFEEDNIIANNWKTFCKMHNWDVKKTKPFLQLRIGNMTYMRNTKERRKFVQFLADGLPERTLYSVYHRFKTLYENNLQRRFKPEEDEMIIDHLENNPSLDKKRKYADLAKVLRRTRHSIYRRYRLLKKRRCKANKDD